MSKKVPKAQSLRAFAAEKRKKDCPLCQLPAAVLKELHQTPRPEGITMPVLIAWLKSLGYNITIAQYQKHAKGGHHLAR